MHMPSLAKVVFSPYPLKQTFILNFGQPTLQTAFLILVLICSGQSGVLKLGIAIIDYLCLNGFCHEL
ncbi:hypothetical protein BKE30_13025 [Alkanindiges hydrocarboniclasticus]|uniref:Uncharacterized protein n=1 Tax=Alkanindiges hydrocarboniclasticus TaxID=1907941 RepID=A0A1S8CSC6_9GAMM|nr:hypothetical protein BKE30_13025 [Alkanindiges hydrocarboniclasticus]